MDVDNVPSRLLVGVFRMQVRPDFGGSDGHVLPFITVTFLRVGVKRVETL